MTEQKSKKVVVEKIDTTDSQLADLIVFNDEYNEFEYVVDCFINVCGLSYRAALDKTNFIHHHGLGTVRTGEYAEMKKMKDQLVDCGLTAIVARHSVN